MGGESLMRELHVWKPNLKIMVKASKKWESMDSDGRKCLEFLLIDEEGTKTIAYVWERFSEYFSRVMQDGLWYEIVGFVPRRVGEDGSRFNFTKHGLTIFFNRDTFVHSIEPITAKYFFGFVEFEDIVGDRCDRNHPIDLVGAIKTVSRPKPYIDNEVIKTSVRFTIRNYNDVVLEFIIFGDLAETFCGQWSSMSKDNDVCVFTDWRVMHTGGGILIQNVAGMSRFSFDLDVSEVGNFRYIDSLNEKIKKTGTV